MTSPTILSLPREIRNIIYDYLSHELVIDWGYRPSPFPLGGHALARLRVREAPLPNVLLSCAQIYHEYSQDVRFTDPLLEINVAEDVSSRLREGQSTNHLHACKVLGRIVRVDFFLYVTMTWSKQMIALDVLEPTIVQLAPRLHTVETAFISYAEDSVQYNTKRLKDLKVLRAFARHVEYTTAIKTPRLISSPLERSVQAY
jgi:hypothetical protein